MRAAISMLGACLVCFTALGCLEIKPTDGTSTSSSSSGDSLGTFHVIGQRTDSSCGPDAFGSTDPWEFNVTLSRDGTALYWNAGGDPVQGEIASDGVTFAFSTNTSAQMTTTNSARGCIMTRADVANGKLIVSGSSVLGFSGTLSYTFDETSGSDCTEVAAEQSVLVLPCMMKYALQANKTE